jgi:hypothetical protein
MERDFQNKIILFHCNEVIYGYNKILTNTNVKTKWKCFKRKYCSTLTNNEI